MKLEISCHQNYINIPASQYIRRIGTHEEFQTLLDVVCIYGDARKKRNMFFCYVINLLREEAALGGQELYTRPIKVRQIGP
jgi:hypothetical protein